MINEDKEIIGKKLYHLGYYNFDFKSEREIRQLTPIKKKKRNGESYFYNREGQFVKRSELGDTWFFTKLECYQKSYYDHLALIHYCDSDGEKRIKKELYYLQKKLTKDQENDSK